MKQLLLSFNSTEVKLFWMSGENGRRECMVGKVDVAGTKNRTVCLDESEMFLNNIDF